MLYFDSNEILFTGNSCGFRARREIRGCFQVREELLRVLDRYNRVQRSKLICWALSILSGLDLQSSSVHIKNPLNVVIHQLVSPFGNAGSVNKIGLMSS